MKKLKIGVLTNNLDSPVWVSDALKNLKEEGIIEIALFIVNKETVNKKNSKVSRLFSSNILYRIYYLIDKNLSRVRSHPFDKVSFLDFFSDAAVIQAETRKSNFRDVFEHSTLKEIESFNLDVLLCRGFSILSGDILNVAKYGVFSFHHGDNRINRGSPALFWEMYLGQKSAGVIFQKLTEELDNGIVLERSTTGIRSLSFSKNLSLHYWKSSKILERSFRKLQKSGQHYINEAIVRNSKESFSFYSYPIYKHPKNSVVIGHVVNIINRVLARKLNSFFNRKEQWRIMIAFTENNEIEKNLWKYKYLNIPTRNNVADPFVICKDGFFYIYFEEWKVERGGFISCVKVDSKGNVHDYYSNVISGSSHFSFPSIFEENGEIYIIPEMSESMKVVIYRCINFPNKFEIYSELLSEVNCFDPHIYKRDNLYYLFVNQKENVNISSYEECFLYFSESLTGPWKNQLVSPISSNIQNSRPAGNILETDSASYRLTQNCEDRYGYSINLNKIIKIDRDNFEEEFVASIEPHFNKKILGVHTFNKSQGCCVIDVCQN